MSCLKNKINFVPLVSVIMPIYNSEKYLRETLDSVVSQTLKKIEIICVDDGSTDNSLKILQEYAQSDKRLTVIQQKNKFAGGARNCGLNYAKGKYVIFLDGDDIFDLTLLEKLYNKSEEKATDLCICQSEMFDEKGITPMPWSLRLDLLPQTDVFSPYDLKSNIFQCCCGYSWDKLFVRKNIKKFNLKFQEIHHSNDTFFVLMYLILSKRISYVKEVLVHYRHNPNSISRIKEKYPDNFFTALSSIYYELCKHNEDDEFIDSFLKLIHSVSQWHYSSMNSVVAKNIVFKKTDELYKIILKTGKYKEAHDLICYYRNENKKRKNGTIIDIYYLFGFLPILKIEEK